MQSETLRKCTTCSPNGKRGQKSRSGAERSLTVIVVVVVGSAAAVVVVCRPGNTS